MRNFTVLVDISGTLHVEDVVIPGATGALNQLRRLSFISNVLFLTNTTKQTSKDLLSRLKKLGFEVEPDEIFSSLSAVKQLIIQRNLKPRFILEDKVREEFDDLDCHESYGKEAVVVGLAPSKFEYNIMNDAFNAILNGADLIAIHKGRYYKTGDGLCLGPGPFVTALEYATDKKAEVIGKPSEKFFNAALSKCNASPSSTFMIGDDVIDDVDGAQKVGIRGILVKTGKYRENDERRINPPPFLVVDSFVEAVDAISKIS